MNEPTELVDVLRAALPPEADQLVRYAVGEGENGVELHRPECAMNKFMGRKPVVLNLRETTGSMLKQSLKTEQIVEVCTSCYYRACVPANMLVESSEVNNSLVNGFCWADCAALLCYEAENGADVNAWCRWLCGKTPEQLREEGRKAVSWDQYPGEQYVACFAAGGFDETSWVLWLGDHVVDVVDEEDNSFDVYGLIPERLHNKNGLIELQGLAVPVDSGFDRQHLALAVSLYLENGVAYQGDWSDAEGMLATAHKAMETARLCLV